MMHDAGSVRSVSLCLVLAGLGFALLVSLWPQTAEAQSARTRERQIDRSLVARDAIRHRQVKRAYVAGAVAQHRRERIRDRIEDRYDDRYRYERYRRDHRDDDDDDDLSRVLIGIAVGAVATGIIMNNNRDGGTQ